MDSHDAHETWRPTRRAFLAGAATVTIAGAVGTATADHPGEQPEHVTLTYDQAELERFRPRLRINHLEVRPNAMYAWKATSPDQDTDAYVYFTHYVTQQGLSSRDSHYLDREPVYVFVDPATESVDRILYSAYHWLKADDGGPPIHEDDRGDPHPTLRVAERWHHYLVNPDKDGQFVEIRKLGDDADLDDANTQTTYEQWLANGWEGELRPGAVVDPWSMTNPNVDSWWADTTDEWLREAFVLASRVPGVDILGASKTDL